MNEHFSLVMSVFLGLSVIPLMGLLFRAVTIEVEDEMAVILTRFGKLTHTLQEPGLHLWWEKSLPWTQVYSVSMKRDYRHYEQIHVNDCRGTTIIIDLWVEFGIKSPERVLFQVENWEKSLQSILTCSATSILGTYEFSQILNNRSELGRTLKEDIEAEISRWGLEIDLVFISKLTLLPDVSQQLFDAVAARLEKTKADIEEAGRLESLLLEAETSAKVANLEAEAKGQYSLGIGRAYGKLSTQPKIFSAYTELYELSMVKPQRTVAFQGFKNQEVSAIEALMSMPPLNLENSYSSHEATL